MAEEVAGGGGGESRCAEEAQATVAENGTTSRKERRKATKKEKRKQKRKELAAKQKEEEAARLNDPEEQRRIQLEEERENERMERERKEFEEHERVFLEALAEKRKAEEEEEEQRRALQEELKQNQVGHEDENENENENEWEYVEEGPPEIIWQGNEIIVKKKKVKVKRKDADQKIKIEDPNRPTSNPFPPESEAFADYKNGSLVSAQQILENAAQQIPNFGTEQDKAHCPFHLKTGACRFGSRCSRVHFYPDKSCTLLMKNMYNGPGLAFEQDEGLEYTDEEVDRCYEEFYEDVHTEFMKFGEIVNFKVCRNSSFHLRGNLYVHYKSLESAVLAYQSINCRYFAGKLVTCEFVGVTKWRVAICGEYMKSRLTTCSRGAACNFIHCFRNPGGDYEWADWDKPPPKYWVKEMAALFGSLESGYDNQINTEGRKTSDMTTDVDRHLSRRSHSRERDSSRSRCYEKYDARRSRHGEWHRSGSRKAVEYRKSMIGMHDSDSDRDWSNDDRGEDRHRSGDTRKNRRNLNSHNYQEAKTRASDSDAYWLDSERNRNGDRNRDRKRDDMYHRKRKKSSKHHNEMPTSPGYAWDRAHDRDSMEEDKDKLHSDSRKLLKHSNEVGEFIETGDKSVKSSEREFKLEKLEPRRVEKRRHATRRDRSSVKREKSFVDSSGDETCKSNSSRSYNWRSNSHDSDCYSNENIDRRGRWDDKIGLGMHKTCRGEFISGDFTRSQDQNLDECLNKSSSGSSERLSHRRSPGGREEVNSTEDSRESRGKKRHRRTSLQET